MKNKWSEIGWKINQNTFVCSGQTKKNTHSDDWMKSTVQSHRSTRIKKHKVVYSLNVHCFLKHFFHLFSVTTARERKKANNDSPSFFMSERGTLSFHSPSCWIQKCCFVVKFFSLASVYMFVSYKEQMKHKKAETFVQEFKFSVLLCVLLLAAFVFCAS